MKRFLAIVGVTLLLSNSGLFAKEDTLIDFSTLAGDVKSDKPGTPDLDAATTVNFGDQAGASFTATDKAQMKVSLAISNWDIVLASSAQTIGNQSLTQIKPALVNAGDAQNKPKFAGDTVLGARIHFPEFAINSFAIIKPAFTIPVYATLKDANGNVVDPAKKGTQFDGKGVIKNVGTVKSIQINVLGRNFPNTLSLLLENEQGQESEIQFGSLKFDGWQSLTWNNPDYQTEVRNRELKVVPLYPRSVPFIKLKGIMIHHDGANEGGDFVTYIRDIKVVYDLARVERPVDVDDESEWGIIGAREDKARQAEIKTLGAQQVLRVLEQRKLALEKNFDDSTRDATATPAAPAPAPAAKP